uniref:Proline dehydrogenase n=1 Tax=Cyprinus carpio TaxID=7962 RepID=A0A8C2A4J2_CYPCA
VAALQSLDPQAFKVKSFWELIQALGVFRLCSFPVLVNNCGKLMTITRKFWGKLCFCMVVRPSVNAQFIAVETEGEIADSMQKMISLGIHPVLAVPIEEDLGESTGERRYEDNLADMLECVHMSHSKGWSKNPMMQLKITALVRPELYVSVSSIKTTLYELRLTKIKVLCSLTECENAHLLLGLQRLNKLGAVSVSKVCVLVDAEYTYINPALSLITMAMMKKFSLPSVWIWNTYQCYLKNTTTSLSLMPFRRLDVKLVRDAYMDKERKLAEKKGRTDPIHGNILMTGDYLILNDFNPIKPTASYLIHKAS